LEQVHEIQQHKQQQTGSDIAAGVAGGMSPELAAQTAAAATRKSSNWCFSIRNKIYLCKEVARRYRWYICI
jgi:hypothetical protein